jgi:hypothetical protein
MPHHTHVDPDGNWYSLCWDCGERYGTTYGSCSCGHDEYDTPDPFDVEPPSDPPEYDPDEAYELAREERIEQERMDYDILHERLEDL